MRRIRILLTRMPALLFDIMHHIVASEPDMTVVDGVDDRDLVAAVRRKRADVILIASGATSEREEYMQLLREQPRVRLIAITDDGRTGSLYELRPHRMPLGELSAEALRAAIRGRRGDESVPHPDVGQEQQSCNDR